MNFKLFIVPPRIQNTEVYYTVNENSQAVLPCVAEGIPTPAINWKKDNVVLANLLGKYTVEPYGELILENVVVSKIEINRYIKRSLPSWSLFLEERDRQ